MFNSLKGRFLIYFLSFFVFVSCTHKKKMIYFQGELNNTSVNSSYNPLLKADDVISITVLALDEQAVKPFNLPVANVNQNIGGYLQGAPTPPGYLIDSSGNIDFPVLGKLKIAGLKRSEAIELLKENLKTYINNPTILIRILNYKITVLGEVRNPGTFTIPNERVTLIEALGIAGDLLITGVRKNILVIRDVDGKKTETRVDLTSKELFSSPIFYLQQNDVVYVQPNRAKINSSIINTANVSLGISVISLFVTMAVLFSR